MKNLIILALIGASIITSINAQQTTCEPVVSCQPEHKYYVSASGSMGDHVGALFPNFATTLAVGHIIDQFRIEVEAGYRESLLVLSNDACSFSAMLNGYYDTPLSEETDLYFGLGAGVTWIGKQWFETPNPSRTAAFTTQGMIGVAFHMTDNVDLTTGYRLIVTPKYEDYISNTLEVGVRLKF